MRPDPFLSVTVFAQRRPGHLSKCSRSKDRGPTGPPAETRYVRRRAIGGYLAPRCLSRGVLAGGGAAALGGAFAADGFFVDAGAAGGLAFRGAGLAASSLAALAGVGASGMSRRMCSLFMCEGVRTHLTQLATRTFRVGFEAGVVGDVFDQVKKFDPAVLWDARSRIARSAGTSDSEIPTRSSTRCAGLSIGIACPPSACWMTVAVT